MLDEWKAKRERQKKIDKIMCKGGYTYNETVKRCIPAYVGGGSSKSEQNSGEIPMKPEESAGIAIAKEGAARKSANKSSNSGFNGHIE